MPQDCAEAVRWFRKAAEQGDAGAQANLGLMHCDSLELQRKLRNLGYDLTVAQSDKPGELTITSKDFDDTDHRVRFLSLLRSRNSPAAEVLSRWLSNGASKDPGGLVRILRIQPDVLAGMLQLEVIALRGSLGELGGRFSVMR